MNIELNRDDATTLFDFMKRHISGKNARNTFVFKFSPNILFVQSKKYNVLSTIKLPISSFVDVEYCMEVGSNIRVLSTALKYADCLKIEFSENIMRMSVGDSFVVCKSQFEAYQDITPAGTVGQWDSPLIKVLLYQVKQTMMYQSLIKDGHSSIYFGDDILFVGRDIITFYPKSSSIKWPMNFVIPADALVECLSDFADTGCVINLQDNHLLVFNDTYLNLISIEAVMQTSNINLAIEKSDSLNEVMTLTNFRMDLLDAIASLDYSAGVEVYISPNTFRVELLSDGCQFSCGFGDTNGCVYCKLTLAQLKVWYKLFSGAELSEVSVGVGNGCFYTKYKGFTLIIATTVRGV